VQRDAIKAAKAKLKKDLSTGGIKDEHLDDEIQKLVAILNSQDAVWREKAEKIDEFEEEIKEFTEHLSDRDNRIKFLVEKLNKTEKNLESAGVKSAGEMTRTEKWMQKIRDQADLYLAWTAAVEAEFSIVIKGPVLYLPDGKVYVIKHAYRRELSKLEHGADLIESIKKSVPSAEWITFHTNHRLGMTSTGEPDWERANGFFAGRVTWSQIWWVACAYICGKATAYAEVNRERVGIKLLGISPERENEFKALFEKYWGKGVQWQKNIDDDEEEEEVVASAPVQTTQVEDSDGEEEPATPEPAPAPVVKKVVKKAEEPAPAPVQAQAVAEEPVAVASEPVKKKVVKKKIVG